MTIDIKSIAIDEVELSKLGEIDMQSLSRTHVRGGIHLDNTENTQLEIVSFISINRTPNLLIYIDTQLFELRR
jgi:hypothetical protein